MTIVDDDVVDATNLQRQWLFRDDQIGEPKANLATDFAKALSPSIQVNPIAARLDGLNAGEIMGEHDLILDTSDNFSTRLVVSDWATALKIPLISAAAAQFQGQVGLFRGWEPSQPCYRCFVGDAFDNDECDNCAELGVLGALTGIVGSFAALLAIRYLVGILDPLAGELFLFDGLSLNLRAIKIPKEPACKACGGNHAEGS